MKLTFTDIALSADIQPFKIQYDREVVFDLIMSGKSFRCVYDAGEGIVDSFTDKGSPVRHKQEMEAYNAAVTFVRKFTNEFICECGVITDNYVYSGDSQVCRECSDDIKWQSYEDRINRVQFREILP